MRTVANKHLAQVRERLARWRSRTAGTRVLIDTLDPQAKSRVEPLVQQLKDHCDRLENDIFRLERGPEGRPVHTSLEPRWSDLEEAWAAVSRQLSPTRACRYARGRAWPLT